MSHKSRGTPAHGPRRRLFARGADRLSLLERVIGFSAVSAGAVVVTQGVLYLAYSVANWPALWANVTAVCAAAGPAFLANRRWVWARTDRHSLTREILPFWGYNLGGLGVSSLLVWLAERWWDSAVFISAANLAGFGALWAGKFVLLDRVLFARRAAPSAAGEPTEPSEQCSTATTGGVC